MNLVKKTLRAVFADQLPADTTNFHTVGRTAVFLVPSYLGSKNKHQQGIKWVDVEMTDAQISALQAKKLTGSFGWSLA